MYICLCKAVSESDLKNVIAETGPNLEKVQRNCGAGTDCGSCESRVRQYINSQLGKGHDPENKAS